MNGVAAPSAGGPPGDVGATDGGGDERGAFGTAAASRAEGAFCFAILSIAVDPEEDLAILHGLGVLDHDLLHQAGILRLDLVHDLHRFDDAEDLAFLDT